MRVLLVYPDLPFSFWTLKNTTPLQGFKALLPPLGLITVAALLPRSWEMKLVDQNVEPLTEDHWRWAEVVMVTGMHLQKDGIRAIAAESRRRGVICVAGGPYATTHPEEMLAAGCDFVVKGEAETVMDRLVGLIAQDRRGTIIEAEKRPEMSLSPIPRFDLLRLDEYVSFSVQTSRGCPYSCEFCDVIALFGRKPRYKSADQFIAELDALRKLGVSDRGIFICDDNFIGNKAHAGKLLDALIPWHESVGKPFCFTTQASVDLAGNPGLIDRMTEANFFQIFVGLESPDEEALEACGKHQNIRNPLLESIQTLCRDGLMVIGSFVIGFDGERKGVGDRIIGLVRESGMPVVMVNLLQAAPKTELWDRLAREGRLFGVEPKGDGMLVPLNYLPSRPATEIMDEFTRAWDEIYEPRAYFERAHRWIMETRPTRAALAQARGETPPPAPKRVPKSLRRSIAEARIFLHIAWRHGIASDYRLLFWRQLINVWRKNPSRIHRYMTFCALAEDMFEIRDLIVDYRKKGMAMTMETEVKMEAAC